MVAGRLWNTVLSEMKFRKVAEEIQGWEILFQNNVHMYCHRLQLTKNEQTISIPCEDTPDGPTGIWLEGIDIDEDIRRALVPVLSEFFDSLERSDKIYEPED